jgi:glycosyltransferase involved in cell wall biosynthesis
LTDGPGLLFVLPSFPGSSEGIDPFWITAAGLARAVGAQVGGADVLTPLGLLGPDELTANAVRTVTSASMAREWIRRLPRPLRLGLADVRAWGRGRNLRRSLNLVAGRRYRLVMQIHRRFHDCGLLAARRAGVPFVLRVDALETREEASWGLQRPGWGNAVERLGELRVIRQADLVAPISDEVDAMLEEAGIDRDRRVVVSSAVDIDAFSPGAPDEQLLRTHKLNGRFVVGWVGGFRPFHGLEAVPTIVRMMRARLPDAVLCLVGAGPLRDEIAERIRGFEESVHLIGPVPHEAVPRWIRSFDACLVLAGAGRFHYSPLKLYEYMGCARPVVAPRIAEMASVLSDGSDALLVHPGDPGAVVDALELLARDPALRLRIGREGRRTAERAGSWEARASTLLAALEARGLLEKRTDARW